MLDQVKPNLLEIKNLRIEATSYPPGEAPRKVVLVDDVSVAVEQGKVLGLIGESGAGKSTIGLSAMAFARGGARLAGGQILLNGPRPAAAILPVNLGPLEAPRKPVPDGRHQATHVHPKGGRRMFEPSQVRAKINRPPRQGRVPYVRGGGV